jgi:hypothetical protein
MWILPKQLHTSAFVPDTEALISDSTEQSEICAQSLLARLKPSPARTWSQRWKRDSWTAHLSGRILKPSHGPSFVTAWTSSLAATRASHSAQPASDSEPKTHDTSGRLSQPELLQCDLVPAFLKTSTDISRWGFPTCCKTWQDWVTERRGAWRQRANAARLTRGSGSSSWPTMHMGSNERGAYYDKTGKGQRYLSDAVVDEQKNWPSPVASEVRQGFQDRSKGMKGLQESLTTVVIKHGQAAPASWPTPIQGDSHLASTPEAAARRLAEGKSTLSRLVESGQAAPASSSSLGSRQGLSWATPAARDTQGQRGAAANARKGNPLDTLPNQMAQWGTPTARDHKSGRGNEEREYKELTPMVERQQTGKLNSQWVTQLMGLPMGWVSPSCPASVIKNWPRFVTGWLQATTAPTSCDSSETALCRPAQSGRSEFFLVS